MNWQIVLTVVCIIVAFGMGYFNGHTGSDRAWAKAIAKCLSKHDPELYMKIIFARFPSAKYNDVKTTVYKIFEGKQ